MKQAVAIIGVLFLTLFIVNSSNSIRYTNEAERLEALHRKQQKTVEKLYTSWYSPVLRSLLTKKQLASRLAGIWAKSSLSRRYIRRFTNDYAINLDEIAEPISSFKNFNAFFIRKLKPESRPLPTDPNALISPADGSALVIQNLGEQTPFPIKQVTLSLSRMLNDPKLTQTFKEGTAIIIRLAPWDYHRFHFPLSGIPKTPRIIKGRYESVSPAAYAAGVQPLELNERHLIRFHPHNTSTIALMLVGALFVGAIVENYTPGKQYQPGDEFGYFEYGGSTIVMLFQKDTIRVLPELLAASAEGRELPVKMGQIIGYVK